MIIWHIGLPWGLLRGPNGPSGPLKRPQGGPIWHIVMYYALRNFLGPFGVMQGHFGSCIVILGHEGSSLKHHFGPWRPILGHKGPFWCCFGSFWGPCGYLNGPRVVQHDIYSCNISMGSVLRSFGSFQGSIWSVASFIPVGPCENGWKNTKNAKNQKRSNRCGRNFQDVLVRVPGA